MSVAEIGFLFYSRSLKGNVLSEKKFFGKKSFFNRKSQISEIFQKCISIIKTVLQLNEPVRGGK